MTADLRFHRLTVTDVTGLTDDSVAIELDTSAAPPGTFDFLPGQHITLRRVIDGEDVRRSYSICSPPDGARIRIGVRRLAGGRFSSWATTRLEPGETLEALPPNGDFVIRPDPADTAHRVAIVAGSGITPVLSLVSATLESSPHTRWTVVYGNQASHTVMFLDELEGLKDRHPTRIHLIHVLSREDTGLELTRGRIDHQRLRGLFATLIDVGSVDEWFLCGPYDMVQTTRSLLSTLGVAVDVVHDELFFAGPPDPTPPPPPDEQGTVTLAVTLAGRTSFTTMRPTTSILDAALAIRPDLPYSCKGGMCASCKATVVSGEVAMTRNWALVAEDLERGFVLTCQAHPVTGEVGVDFDRR